ncbi:MAG: IclR family transcriptional regulator [Rhizobium sp.]|nr:IclR family transcriptional regulator [Rhizobium sp.]
MDVNPKEDGDARSGIQVIARAASILRALKNENDGLSLGQIAERVDLPRSTVQRIVGALQSEQFVIAASPDRGIRLGPQLAALAEAAKIDMTEKLRPFLTDLAKRTRETVDLAVLRGKRLVFIDQIPGTHRLRTVSQVGETFPLTDTANGKACLAKLGEKERSAVFANEDVSGEHVNVLLDELERVRETGLAFDRDEHTDGISAVGAAFFDRQGDLYAISLPTPSSRFKLQEGKLAEHLLQTLKQIERLELVNVRR